MPIRCEIVSQDRLIWEGDADIVVIPGSDGQMGILPNHAPLLSTIDFGVIQVRGQGEEYFFTVFGGVVEVQPEIVTVLADIGEDVEQIDTARAEAAKARAEEILAEGPPPDMDALLRLEAALKRSNLRLEAVRKHRRAGTSRRPFDVGS